jgi:prephenate dehydrogenase
VSAQKPTVTIVGLGLIGASMGLSLVQAGAACQVVGHDRSGEVSGQAKKLGAVNRTEWNLVSACEKADVVILAIPFGGIQETLQAIGPRLRPGCVVLDTAAPKAPVLEWADGILPEEVHFVGLGPILRGTPSGPGGVQAARADLFQGGLIGVIPSSRASSDAVKVGIDLVTILGSRPVFYDALEHDGLLAGVDALPVFVALALFESASLQPTWRETRKLAGPTFESATQALQADPQILGEMAFGNRANLRRWIDGFTAALDSLRELLNEEEATALVGRLSKAQKERNEWLHLRAQGAWDEGHRPEVPPKQSLLQPLFGGLWPRGPQKAKKP